MADVTDETVVVETVKFAVVEPAATRTLARTVAEPLLLVNVTVAPPLGAAADNVTVPVDEEPPVTVAGESVRLETVGSGAGLIVKIAVFDVLL